MITIIWVELLNVFSFQLKHFKVGSLPWKASLTYGYGFASHATVLSDW